MVTLLICSACRSNDVDVMMSYSEYVKVTNYLREMLCQVCDHAHDRCVKLLVARARVSLFEHHSKEIQKQH